MENYFIYSDASFDKGHGIGVSGYLFFKNKIEHEKSIMTGKEIVLKSFIEKNNIRSEIRGVILALEMMLEITGDFKLHLYTDCQTVSNLDARRKKLEKTKFISKSKNKPLPNTDLYKILFDLFDKLNPEIHWVPGHSPKTAQDLIQKNFSILDKAVRKKLRQTV